MIWTALFAYAHLLAAGIAGALLVAENWLLARPLDRRQLQLLARADLGYLLAVIAVVATGMARASFGAGLRHYLANPLFLLKLGIAAAWILAALVAAGQIAAWTREARPAPTFAPLSRDLERLRVLLALQVGLLALLPLPAALVARGFGA
jgi:putative membrane protein